MSWTDAIKGAFGAFTGALGGGGAAAPAAAAPAAAAPATTGAGTNWGAILAGAGGAAAGALGTLAAQKLFGGGAAPAAAQLAQTGSAAGLAPAALAAVGAAALQRIELPPKGPPGDMILATDAKGRTRAFKISKPARKHGITPRELSGFARVTRLLRSVGMRPKGLEGAGRRKKKGAFGR
jgi:hypothetical protein